MANPGWLSRFVEQVSEAMVGTQTDIELGCHVFRGSCETGTEWEVTVFPLPSTGSRRLSGVLPAPGFSIDVGRLLCGFESTQVCRWQSTAFDVSDDLAAHLSVEGRWEGRQVWLRVLAEQPAALAGRPAKSSLFAG